MALAGRSSRRGRRAGRWLIAGLVLTLAVLLVNASLNSRSPATVKDVSTSDWMDQVLPVISQSTEQGNQINQVRAHALQMTTVAVTGQLHAAATAAVRSYRQLITVRPPGAVNAAAGLLEACMLVRSQAAGAMATAFDRLLSSPAPPPSNQADPAVQAIINAGQDFQVADRAYQLFLGALPGELPRPSNSVWVSDPSQYDPTSLGVFVASLRNSANLAPVHQLTVVSVTTIPPSVRTQGAVHVLPPVRQISVTIVVADTGNQPEKDLTVTASIEPSAGASSVRDFISLSAAGAQSLSIGPLSPPLGVPVTLTASVTPAAGSGTPAAKSIIIEMPGPNTVITATSVAGAPPTAGAGGSSATTPSGH